MKNSIRPNLTQEKKAAAEDHAGVLLEQLKPLIKRCLHLNHDLNNPLTGIVGYVEFLLSGDEPLTSSQKEYLNQIAQCTERIEKEINDLCEIKIKLSEEIDISGIFPDDRS
ncbi:MAG: histidine kinase dimerization/phospho-acceptor domain-containing protein [Candidatus Zixiibacteriota bacterium]